jgi:hypothetical protein
MNETVSFNLLDSNRASTRCNKETKRFRSDQGGDIMALKTEERGQPSLLEHNDQTTAEPRMDSVRARGLAPRRLRAKRLLVDFQPRYEDGWKTADELGRRLRRQEAPIGAIALLLLAVATVTVTYLYY